MAIGPVKISNGRPWYPRKVRGKKVWRRACKDEPGTYWEITRVHRGRFVVDRFRHIDQGRRVMLNNAVFAFNMVKNAARYTEEE